MPNFSVITDKCIKDLLCLDVCMSDAIHPTADEPRFSEVTQLYINPAQCSNCGACYVTCEWNAIFAVDDLPRGFKEYAAINAEYYAN